MVNTDLFSLQFAMATGYIDSALSELLLAKSIGARPMATWSLPIIKEKNQMGSLGFHTKAIFQGLTSALKLAIRLQEEK